MAENQTSQERTEQATPKRLADAREKGQLPRSRELTTMLMLISVALVMYASGDYFVSHAAEVLRDGFTLSKTEVFDTGYLYLAFFDATTVGLAALMPVFFATAALAFFGPLGVGGWSFSGQALAAKFDRLDPIKGLKRVFGPRGLVEVLKALAKFVLILGFALAALHTEFDVVSRLGLGGTRAGLAQGADIVLRCFIVTALATIVIALADVPFQIWEHGRKLKMTRQEVKDELKQSEGSPEQRARIRALQQEVATRRMMEEVPKADVIVTNPSHYAVALRFDPETMAAPRVVAKGADLIALKIREIAAATGVAIVSQPALARSIYHTTKINREIPAGLYVAVAQVLAYVFQLKRGTLAAERLAELSDLPIPAELQY